MYGGMQAAPPGQGLGAGMSSIGGSLGGIFGVVGGLINSILNLVTSVVTGVINLVMSVVKAVLSPILGLFGIGKGGGDKQQAGKQQQGQVPAQVPMFNQGNQQVLQTADQTLNFYRDQVRQAQANQQDASTTNWFQMMQKADADFQARRQELAQAFGPNSQQVMGYDGAVAQVKADMQALAGGGGNPAAKTTAPSNPNDLSQLQLPNDPNLLNLVRNLQLLMACPAQAATLSASERAEVDTASTQMAGQIQALQSSNPTLANQLMGFYAKFQQDWNAAKAATPAATGSTQPGNTTPTQNPAGGTGRKYRDIPLELPGDSPSTTPQKTPVPADLGGE
jgi:hypothetical protein